MGGGRRGRRGGGQEGTEGGGVLWDAGLGYVGFRWAKGHGGV
jgi:hypothetical protein